MKPRHWFFLVGLLLYVAGIGFAIAGAFGMILAFFAGFGLGRYP